MLNAEGKATDVLRMKRVSQIWPAVWCKGRIQVLMKVVMKGGEPPMLLGSFWCFGASY